MPPGSGRASLPDVNDVPVAISDGAVSISRLFLKPNFWAKKPWRPFCRPFKV
jgi:hypothetical protein